MIFKKENDMIDKGNETGSAEMAQAENAGRPCLMILAVLQLLMLGALYTKTPPHPPLEVAIFALAPFISASIALALAACMMTKGKTASLVSLLACLTALVSYGPHKWFGPSIGSIWPAVLLAQVAILAIVFQLFDEFRSKRTTS